MTRWPPLGSGGRCVDLHAHTTFSDGSLAPEALVALAVERGLSALGVTDHDSTEALPRAQAAIRATLELVPGIELSSAAEGLDLHILGYYIDAECGALCERLARFGAERRERTRAILQRLAELGAQVEEETVLALAGPGVVGRPHIAMALIQAGHARDLDEAFRRFLGSRGAAFVRRPAFTPEEAIALIHVAQGVSVLAHPGPLLAHVVVERLAAAGLRGIEIWHPQHTPTTMRRLHALATRLGLLETGGSDFHGPGRGADLGSLEVPAEVMGPLKQVAGVAG
ncbi:MAG: PHP domain-containing protein [Candidatus Eisenbacteria bacterium]|uniref:PHP domain-containing protein n=1 Tax=Eiseniibacteriota bacterium TaxID=2212470 RepID=A0A538TV84_UNCEI|nr:MAG: PHP domain-containing protein [Candidatus Eisenbacteria bacterium]